MDMVSNNTQDQLIYPPYARPACCSAVGFLNHLSAQASVSTRLPPQLHVPEPNQPATLLLVTSIHHQAKPVQPHNTSHHFTTVLSLLRSSLHFPYHSVTNHPLIQLYNKHQYI
ncbi:hypothetical protein UPYG_G00030670 [Umbra pygmaea]|uniref:Uncharacterized protein n=1 Tax=Umbra pygmaea TaxID=75934 RepID=A0ABD0XPP3_UMBPY